MRSAENGSRGTTVVTLVVVAVVAVVAVGVGVLYAHFHAPATSPSAKAAEEKATLCGLSLHVNTHGQPVAAILREAQMSLDNAKGDVRLGLPSEQFVPEETKSDVALDRQFILDLSQEKPISPAQLDQAEQAAGRLDQWIATNCAGFSR